MRFRRRFISLSLGFTCCEATQREAAGLKGSRRAGCEHVTGGLLLAYCRKTQLSCEFSFGMAQRRLR